MMKCWRNLSALSFLGSFLLFLTLLNKEVISQTSFMEKAQSAQKKLFNEIDRERAAERLIETRKRTFSYSTMLDKITHKNWCLGVSRAQSFCYSIRSNDEKNACLGMSGSSTSCYLIKNSDYKNFCLGTTDYSSNCYLIKNKSIKNTCLAISKREYKDLCYGIDKNWQYFCLGVTQQKDQCFAIN